MRGLVLQRAVIAGLICFLLLGAVIARVAWLQVTAHERFASLAEQNRTRIEPIPPARGLIYDRNGVVLADNAPAFQVELVPEQVPDMEATLQRLATLLELDESELGRFRKTLKASRSFDSIPLKLNLTEEEVARLAVERPRLPGVEVQARLTRVYPQREKVAHVVGYVGRINERDLATIDQEAYRGTSHIGKTGLERFYEDRLHGEVGYRKLEVDAHGRTLRVLEEVPATPGEDIHLTLDLRLQEVAEAALGDFLGAVVALDPRNGEVLAFVSKPGFDPNLFVNGIRGGDYKALVENPDRPLFNRALAAAYPPGSTVKPLMGLAGLEHGLITPEFRMFAGPYYQLPNDSHRYRDWKKSGHGWVDLDRAIAQSCDVYFYDLAQHLGIERMHDYMTQFGFGQKTGIDLDGERNGLYPSLEWKKRHRRQPWFPGETLIAGIGQGYVQVTPVQLARAVATLASKGRVVQPRVVGTIKSPLTEDNPYPRGPAEKISIDPAHWRTVVDAMIDVVHSQAGTAKGIAPGLSYHIAGKTGTAQVFTVRQDQDYKKMRVKETLKDHAWFIAFAPAEEPRIAVAVLAENGGHGGSVAAPIAKAVIEQYLKGSP